MSVEAPEASASTAGRTGKSGDKFMSVFVPGLVVGLVIGLFAGAYVVPLLSQSSTFTPKNRPPAQTQDQRDREQGGPGTATPGDHPAPANPPADAPKGASEPVKGQ